MKDYDDLVGRFEEIKDLPVDEEQLGAYLECRLDQYEMEETATLIRDNAILKSIVEDVTPEVMYGIGGEDIYCQELINDEGHDDMLFEPTAYYNDAPYNNDTPAADIYIPQQELTEDIYGHDVMNGLNDSDFELPDVPFV